MSRTGDDAGGRHYNDAAPVENQTTIPHYRNCRKPQFEFIAVSKPSARSHQRRQVSKATRAQVMRDYIRKKSNHSLQSNYDRVPTTASIDDAPSSFKGRFRLKAEPPKRIRNLRKADAPSALAMPLTSPSPLVSLAGIFDPFDAFGLALSRQSSRLIEYYYHGCLMDFITRGVGRSQCLIFARHNLELFHSILCLVSFDYNLRMGLTETPSGVFHSTEACHAINRRLEQGTYSSTTIASVALLAIKESVDGKLESSRMHMDGLQAMVEKFGGLENVKADDTKTIQWADFCHSSISNSVPRFQPLVPGATERIAIPSENETPSLLKAEGLSGRDAPIVHIIRSLRRVTSKINNTHHANVYNLRLDQDIHDIEFQLQLFKVDATSPGRVFSSTAMLLYIYLAIRGLPPQSRLIVTLVERLRTAITLDASWCEADANKQVWLLWVLFIGLCAAKGCADEDWFFQQLANQLHVISGNKGVELFLKRVLWHDTWCSKQYKRLKRQYPSVF